MRFGGLVAADIDPNAPLPATNASELSGSVCNPDKRRCTDNLTLRVDDLGWQRSPLPLLTVDGGPAGGDRRPTWAGDRLYYSRRPPGRSWEPIG